MENNAHNKLINEKSPYLLQHADNPVNWYPWGQEAFSRAKERDVPVFLSIGYSTCHWCHVMAHESFEDPETAELLNRNFVAIKVDREERPDIDAVYMRVCQALTGSGGWPLTIIMTPDQKPFWAGTYLPKKAIPGSGMFGLIALLERIASQWQTNREKLLRAGEQITDYLVQSSQETSNAQHMQGTEPAPALSRTLLQKGASDLLRTFDPKWGGFGQAPKFPSPHNLLFLLAYSQLENNAQADEAVRYTLNQMYRGGIFDHIGGGFSRYSTDEKWLVPHFEKMLYDNALLALAYLEYYHKSHDQFYEKTARRTLDYVLRELTSPEGGFYCGQDADSEGVEGKFYVFTPDEIRRVLGQSDGELFCRRFGITEEGNFEGKNIPNLLLNPDYTSMPLNLIPLREKLMQYRKKRTALHKDDKVLTSWNGLMIAAFSRAYGLLGEPDYLLAAERAAGFIQSHLTDHKGRLMIRWRDGHAVHQGQLDDYAFFIFGLLELYRATLKTSCLTSAISLADQMVMHFWDQENGGLFLTSNEGEQLIYRPKEHYDGALPSGNSVAALVFVRLFELTGEIRWKTLAEQQCSWIAETGKSLPAGFTFGLLAMTELLYPSTQLVCTSRQEKIPDKMAAFLKENRESNLSAVLKHPGNEKELAAAAPFTASYPIPENGALYYFCENGTCSAPVTL